ncbi:amino acid adenylation domain-containing protein [Nonomuraea sp. NEAU-A123]|uniref:amino acid adenylation domain-containing protein n=1 Tax=Nonomuraea sp. NEAU-A123 TaxID=2839649 RepID=UPI001BE44CFC|nr:amino acid adenylation domain-containing protein [Nonomuraea sp. NEAU-A123]MBT2224893.1 amino acid adenylation domain-containing protein [Nonomuraea sp. NEAU-A123]
MSYPHDVMKDFAGAVSRYPDRPAITHNGRTLTYTELHAWVRATARRLRPRPGVVGVLASRSPATVAGLLGTLAAGGTYVPIDPAHPWPRRRALMSASGCATVIATEPTEPTKPTEPAEPGGRLVGLPSLPDLAESAHKPEPDTDVVVAGDDPAYILFTSGSTGAPKPVVTPRRAITTATRALRELFGLTPGDRVLQFASLNWDTCFEEILPTLTTGATLVFHDHAHSGSFHRVLRMIDAERITVLDLPSAFWHELVRHLVDERATLPACVRLVVIGGEAVSPARLADWRALGTDGIRLVNTYGCTETTLITHAIDLHGPLAAGGTGERVPIGRPLPHVRQHLSEDGELLVGGPSLALGYRGLPEATAERFVELGSERYFRTGDRVSPVADGSAADGPAADGALVYEGRLDHELKIRGIRVDPGEVEAQISGHPRVGAVAVAGVTVADHTTLAAYIVPGPSADDDPTLAADIRDYLRDRVPCHLVPSRITVVPELVYTASGKVDRAGSHRRYASATV